jgi:hypothetical protein
LIEISPELVLVDPELAQVARLRLAEEAAARDSVVLRQSEPPPPSSATSLLVPIAGRPVAPRLDRATAAARATAERMTPTLLFVSLLLNLVFAASLFAGNSDAPTLEPEPPAAKPLGQMESTSNVPTAREKTSPRHRPAQHARTVVHAGVVSARTKADAERTVLALALQGGRGRAPKLIDPRTGQLRNNVQSVCRGAGDGSLLCVVSPPHHKPGEGLYFRYHPRRGTGGAAIIWLGYRLSG